MVFETCGIDCFEAGYTFRDLVFGLEALQKEQTLGKFERGAFHQIKFMLKDKESRGVEPYVKYEEFLKEKKISPFEFNSRLVKVLDEKDLSHFKPKELESALDVFKYLAGYYILKMQGINVD